ILLILITFLLTTTITSARDRYPYHHRHPYRSGIHIGPPDIDITSGLLSVILPSLSSPSFLYGYRVWVPGYWEERWTPYGCESAWVPGHWRYEY
ncbi:MAG: hypothetical protein MUO28_04800, partial [Desulfobacterales bacterium]|nr:hypothetical protein [Desulfobacterales bacterium]